MEAPGEVNWTVTVTVPLPNCPCVEAGWEKSASQSGWGEWRTESRMRGSGVFTTIVPPASEPLGAGDEYIVKVGKFMSIRCRVIESSTPGTAAGENGEMVFDAMGTAMGGLVRARFRFSVFRNRDGMVMARAQEKIMTLQLLAPSSEILESEHRHTLRDLNNSFASDRGSR